MTAQLRAFFPECLVQSVDDGPPLMLHYNISMGSVCSNWSQSTEWPFNRKTACFRCHTRLSMISFVGQEHRANWLHHCKHFSICHFGKVLECLGWRIRPSQGIYLRWSTATDMQLYIQSLSRIWTRDLSTRWDYHGPCGYHDPLIKSMVVNPSLEANSSSAVQKFAAFYGTRRFITSFTRTHHWCPEPDESSPHTRHSSLMSILILFVHLRLYPPRVLFLSGLRKEILSALLFSPTRATCPPSHLTLIDLGILVNLARSTSCEAKFHTDTIPQPKLYFYLF
jgi:hypothetical protein